MKKICQQLINGLFPNNNYIIVIIVIITIMILGMVIFNKIKRDEKYSSFLILNINYRKLLIFIIYLIST